MAHLHFDGLKGGPPWGTRRPTDRIAAIAITAGALIFEVMRRSSVGLRGGAAQRPSHANGSREKHIWIAQVCLVCLRVAIGSCVRGDNDYRSDVAPWPMTFGKLKPLMEGGEKPPKLTILSSYVPAILAHKHERTTSMPATIPDQVRGTGMTREM